MAMYTLQFFLKCVLKNAHIKIFFVTYNFLCIFDDFGKGYKVGGGKDVGEFAGV